VNQYRSAAGQQFAHLAGADVRIISGMVTQTPAAEIARRPHAATVVIATPILRDEKLLAIQCRGEREIANSWLCRCAVLRYPAGSS